MTKSNHQHSEHSEHNHEGHNEGHQEQVQEQAPIVETSTVSFKAGDVALPLKHKAGDVLDDTLAKILNAAFSRQFVNNMNAAFDAFTKKLEAGKAKADENPCTEAKLLATWATYIPNVGAQHASLAERQRLEAGNRALAELLKEQNEAVDAGNVGPLGAKKIVITGKGAKEVREALVQKVLASPKQAERVQRHLDAIIAEAAIASEPKEEVVKVTTESLAEIDF